MKIKIKTFLLLLLFISCENKERDYLIIQGQKEIKLFYENLYLKNDFKYLDNYIIKEVNNYRFFSDKYNYHNHLDQTISLAECLKNISKIYGKFISYVIIKEEYFYAYDYGIFNIVYYTKTEFDNCTTEDEIIFGYRKDDPKKKIMLAQYNSNVIKWKKIKN